MISISDISMEVPNTGAALAFPYRDSICCPLICQLINMQRVWPTIGYSANASFKLSQLYAYLQISSGVQWGGCLCVYVCVYLPILNALCVNCVCMCVCVASMLCHWSSERTKSCSAASLLP